MSPSLPAGGPPAGRRVRPSGWLQTSRYPGRPETSAAPARRGVPESGRGAAPPSRQRPQARVSCRRQPVPVRRDGRSGTGRIRRLQPARSRNLSPGCPKGGWLVDQVAHGAGRRVSHNGISPRRLSPPRPCTAQPGRQPDTPPVHRAPSTTRSGLAGASSTGCGYSRWSRSRTRRTTRVSW